jgi:RNA recognition motif-containing protein
MSTKLYVGNLPYQVTEQNLKELFSEAGGVESVKIITDSYTGQARGFGFVEMSTKEEAQKAITLLNGKSFMERTLTVNEARPQEKRERGFGGGGGGGGGARGGGGGDRGGRGGGRGRR